MFRGSRENYFPHTLSICLKLHLQRIKSCHKLFHDSGSALKWHRDAGQHTVQFGPKKPTTNDYVTKCNLGLAEIIGKLSDDMP